MTDCCGQLSACMAALAASGGALVYCIKLHIDLLKMREENVLRDKTAEKRP